MDEFYELSQADQEDLLLRLTAFAHRLLQRRLWRGTAGAAPPGAAEAMDVVHTVVTKYLDGTRQYNKEVGLEQNLFGGVKSVVYALSVRGANKFEKPIGASDGVAPSDSRSPEAEVDGSRRAAQILAYLRQSTSGDSQLETALSLFEQGQYTSSELEERLRLDRSGAKALRRRFSRALQRAIDQVENEDVQEVETR